MLKPSKAQLFYALVFSLFATTSPGQEHTDSSLNPDVYGNYTLAISIDPVQLIAGEFPISAQYAPWDWLEVEAGLGLTGKPRWILFSEKLMNESHEYEDRKLRYKPSFHAMLKFLPGGYAFDDGLYVGTMYRFKNYSADIGIDANSSTGLEYFPEQRLYQDVGLVFGYQLFTEINNLYLDFYGGPALRLVNKKTLAPEFPGYSLKHEKYTTGTLLLGMKIGYVFL